MNRRLLALAAGAVLAGAVAYLYAPVAAGTLYDGAMLVGLGAFVYLQLRSAPAWGP